MRFGNVRAGYWGSLWNATSMLSHPVLELRCMGASPASTTAVVVSFTPATASSPSAAGFTAKIVAVVCTPTTSSPTASPASARSNLHCCQLWPNSLACDTTTLNVMSVTLNGVLQQNGDCRFQISFGPKYII